MLHVAGPLSFRVLTFRFDHTYSLCHLLSQVDCTSAVLQPGEARDIGISFRPTAAVAYRDAIPLHINGLYTVNVLVTGRRSLTGCSGCKRLSPKVKPLACAQNMLQHPCCPLNQSNTGEGVPLCVELADPSRQTVAFGAVPRGQSVSRTLVVMNRGRAAATFSLARTASALGSRGIEVAPAAPLVLKPKEQASLSFTFR